MKRWNRLLAALLAALMLCGAWSVLANAELEDDASAVEAAEEELAPEAMDALPEEMGEAEIDAQEPDAEALEVDIPEDEAAEDEDAEDEDAEDEDAEDEATEGEVPEDEAVEDEPAEDEAFEDEAIEDEDAEDEDAEDEDADLLQSNDANSDFDIEDGELVKYRGPGGDVVIPEDVTSIGAKAFYKCKSLISVTIPDSVEMIEDGFDTENNFFGAFAYCSNLARVTFPNNLTYIGYNAFYNCDSLRRVSLPDSVTAIGDYAFDNCDGLESVTIPSSVTTIEKYAFEDSNPTFHTLPGSDASNWAKDKGFKVVEDVTPSLVLKRDATQKVSKGDRFRITLNGREAKSFTSSDTDIATVSKSGLVKVKDYGTATITVTLTTRDKLVLTLMCPFSDAALSETTLSLEMGKTASLTVSNLEGSAITWSTSNRAIATVDRGQVTAVEPGQCAITARMADGNTLTCEITVTDPAELSKTSLQLMVGNVVKLRVSELQGRTVTWSSGNNAIATVQSGLVTAVKPGRCSITATVGSTRLTCAVTVIEPLKGDIHSILGMRQNRINLRLTDELRYYDDNAYANDYFLVETSSDRITSVALLADAESDIGKYTLFGLYPGMDYDAACRLLDESGWKLDLESPDKSTFYNPEDSGVSLYVTVVDSRVDLIVYTQK